MLPVEHPLRNREDRDILKLVTLVGTFSSLSLLSEKIIDVQSGNLSLAMLSEVSTLLVLYYIEQYANTTLECKYEGTDVVQCKSPG